jgi:hypothetical protein
MVGRGRHLHVDPAKARDLAQALLDQLEAADRDVLLGSRGTSSTR